jgi:D-psicose/D-tagatose/L-ribulose 3-epimerase
VKIDFNMLLRVPAITVAHRPIFEDLKAGGYDGVEIPVIAGGQAEYEALAAMLDDIGLERRSLTVLPHGGNPLSMPISRSSIRRRRSQPPLDILLMCIFPRMTGASPDADTRHGERSSQRSSAQAMMAG